MACLPRLSAAAFFTKQMHSVTNRGNRDSCSKFGYQVSPPDGGGHAHSLCRNTTTCPR